MRAFIAIPIPGTVVEQIQQLQSESRTLNLKARWTPPKNFHLTLKFLGEISEEDVLPISEMMRRAVASIDSFSLHSQGVGVFPSPKNARVLWVGFHGAIELLTHLAESIENGCQQLGFEAEVHAFQPHLTIARFKARPPKTAIKEILEQFNTFQSDAFFVNRVNLYQSRLKPTGATYSKLFSISLSSR